VFDGWDKPALTLVLSGEQHGYLEPCGCSATQSGGLSRRADLFRQIDEKGWPVVGLDLGGTLKNPRQQSIVKFQTILEGLKAMHYAALALGPEELRLGPDQLLSVHLPDELVPFLSANVVFYGTPDLGTPLRSRLVEVGGVKVGVAAILGLSYKDELLPKGATGADQPLTVNDPAVVLPKVIEELQAQQPDLLVLLSHARLAESQELAKKFPQFELVLSAGGPEEPEAKPIPVDKSWVVTVGGKGKHVVGIGFYPDRPEGRLRYELIDLDKHRFKNTPRMDDLMRQYQDKLRELDLAATELPISHPSGAAFVGAAKCGECHTKAYNKWKTTRHAQAYESLKVGREDQRDNWISRIHDPECLACHVTGWNPQQVLRYKTGFESAEKSPHLLGQQCENCHGPGSEHVAVEEVWKKKPGPLNDKLVKWRKALHLDKQVAQDRVCHECHDPDNSPRFKFDEYWKKVEHPWRD
jgi:hypothetical protein